MCLSRSGATATAPRSARPVACSGGCADDRQTVARSAPRYSWEFACQRALAARDQAATTIGRVVAVGDDNETIKVVTGALILFAKYAGTDLRLDGDDYLILDMADLLAVIETSSAKAARPSG